MVRTVAAVLAPILLAGCSVFGIRSGYEAPPYEVVERLGETVEVRRYAPRLAAEVRVDADDFRDGQNAAFEILFDYISGANRTDAKIAMTAPVETAQASEEIAMTVPVETARAGNGATRMRFFLPSAYTLETAPEPTDPRVRIVRVPGQTMAVLTFSGLGREAAVAERSAELLGVLDAAPWRATSEPVAYFYDPPWTMPFFRRNEVVVPVTR